MTPDEQEPYRVLQILVKKCLAVDPKQRADAKTVARGLYVAASRAGWLQ